MPEMQSTKIEEIVNGLPHKCLVKIPRHHGKKIQPTEV
jgi:hypothetical protein